MPNCCGSGVTTGKCLFSIELRSGVLIIAAIEIVLKILAVVIGVTATVLKLPVDKVGTYVFTTVAVIALLGAIFLLVGVLKDKPELVFIYILLNVIFLIVSFVIIVYSAAVHENLGSAISSFIIHILMSCVVPIIFLFYVRSYYVLQM